MTYSCQLEIKTQEYADLLSKLQELESENDKTRQQYVSKENELDDELN